MDILEAKNNKRDVEQKMEKLVEEFEKLTNLYVESIIIERGYSGSGGWIGVVTAPVLITLEVRI